jgi:hypothetical protein
LCTLGAVALSRDDSPRFIPQALALRIQLLSLIEVSECALEIATIGGGASFPHVLLSAGNAVAVGG